jgi:hypothetical protein
MLRSGTVIGIFSKDCGIVVLEVVITGFQERD